MPPQALADPPPPQLPKLPQHKAPQHRSERSNTLACKLVCRLLPRWLPSLRRVLPCKHTTQAPILQSSVLERLPSPPRPRSRRPHRLRLRCLRDRTTSLWSRI
jgi:hypothetical protein